MQKAEMTEWKKYTRTLPGGAEQRREPAGERISEPEDFRGGARGLAGPGWIQNGESADGHAPCAAGGKQRAGAALKGNPLCTPCPSSISF